MNVKTKIILIAAVTAIVQVVTAVLMVLACNWLFDGWLKIVLMLVISLIGVKFVFGQIPWAMSKINESR